MTQVFCFSGSGNSRAAAEYFAHKLAVPCIDIGDGRLAAQCTTAVVVFPVYSQNIPEAVRRFLRMLDAQYVVLCAAYGRIHPGNVLHEAERLVHGTVIAGAHIPTGHSFLGEGPGFDAAGLSPIILRIAAPEQAIMPRIRKQFFADIFPDARSRMLVKIKRSDACVKCGACERTCPAHSMRTGVPHGGCIRCLRCVAGCAQGALSFEISPLLRLYLRAGYHKDAEVRVYL